MSLVLVTGPTEYPWAVGEIKTQLRVDVSDEDDLIGDYIAAATRFMEERMARAFCTQTWRLNLQAWPNSDRIRIPRPPLASVSSIKYKDQDGNESTFGAANYIVDLDAEPGQVVLATGANWPTGTLYPVNPIYIEFVAGYGDAEDVPAQIRQGVRLLVGHWYENREGTAPTLIRTVPMAVDSIIWLNTAYY